MRPRPLLSIVVPVYNVAAYLPDLIDSFALLRERSVEYIFVNDASTDNGADLLTDFVAREAAKLVHHVDNQGLSAARNTGLSHAAGEYVWFIDSDDLIDPEFPIAELFRILTQERPDIVAFDYHYLFTYENELVLHGRPMAGPVQSTLNIKAPKARRFTPERRLSHTEGLMACLFLDSRMYAWSAVFRRRLFKKPPFEPGRFYEDIGATPSLFAEADTVWYLPTSAILYRQRVGSIMRQRSPRKDLDIAAAMAHNLPSLIAHGSKLSDDDRREWARFNLLCLSWATRGLLAGGDLHRPDIWQEWMDAVSRYRTLPVPLRLKTNLHAGLPGRADRLLGLLITRCPGFLKVVSRVLAASPVARRLAQKVYGVLRQTER